MANLLERASVVLTPTAYNNGEALCIKPDDASGDFQFSRNSAATRVNAQGLVENVQILSSNLVQNPSFSEEGVQEVSNGSFSQEGVQLITNGDFSSDTNWNKQTSNWTIANGYAICDGLQTTNSSLFQDLVVVNGNSYRIDFTITDSANDLNLILGATTIGQYGAGTHSIYVTKDANASARIFFQATASNGFQGSIDNVSVREVGQDWSFVGDFEVNNQEASITNASQYSQLTNQIGTNYLLSGKAYKLTADIETLSISGALAYRYSGGAVQRIYTTDIIGGKFTAYFTMPQDGNFWFQTTANYTGLNATITNISVKEVGQNWTILSPWIVGNNVLSIDGSQVSNQYTSQVIPSLTSGNKYKLQYTVSNITAGQFRINVANTLGTYVSSNGTYEFVFNATSGTTLQLQASTTLAASVTNISVIEITDDTNLPRINYEGFSYQDALGSELVLNGTFDSNIDFWNKGGGNVNPLSWNNGKIKITNDVAQLNSARQTIVTEIGKTYKVSADVDSTNGITPRLASSNPTTAVIGTLGTIEKLTYTFTATSTSSQIELFNWQNTINKYNLWDNVSVKEYLGQEVVPDSGCGSWLFEPQSTNTLTYSEDFSQWNNISATLTSGQLSPSGEYNATKISGTIGSSVLYIGATSSPTATRSIYARSVSGTGTAKLMSFNANTNNLFTLTEDWQRFELTGTTNTGGNTSFYIDFRDNTQTLNEIIVWGGQSEELTYATSYIPTNGEANGVTRNQDVCTNGGSLASINSTSGTLYAEIAALNQTANVSQYITISDGTYNNRASILFSNGSTNSIRTFLRVGGVPQIDVSNAVSDVTDFNKIAFSYKENNFKIYLNGVLVSTDTSGSVWSADTVTKLSFSEINTTGGAFFGKTKALAVWKEALSDQELADLTYPTPTFPTFTLDFNTIAEQFTFARGSEATYVDAQGLIQSTNEIGEELVVNGSFDSDTAWTKGTGWTISGGTANALSAGSAVSITQNGVVESGKTYKITYTISNYVEGGIYFRAGSGTNGNIRQENGTFTEIVTQSGNTTFYLTCYTGSTTLSIDNVSVKEYITATNTPRLDYSTGAEAFLLEPQSTNLITYSEDFSNSYWAKSSVTLTSGFLAPDGSTNAFKVEGTIGTSYLANLTANTNVRSIYVRTVSGTGQVKLLGNTTLYDINEQWTRVSFNPTSSTYQFAVDFRGGTNISEVLIWGAQSEALDYATSYIPSAGSQTTRNQETCINATPEINSEEGVLYFESAALSDGFGGAISLSDGTSSNYIYLYYHPSGTKIVAKIVVNSITVYDKNITTLDEVNYNKIAFKYQDSSFKIFANGVNISSLNQNSGNTFPINILNKLSFDNGAGSTPFYGNTKDVQVYTKALSDAELIKLTTI